ncbi:hypothetical protein [Kineococcus radiotolerans]|uniref:Uncharacterized protein n=1 Tax=Kineococcus radiotolerans (strain ATCC BAA-149 / DSM 14245 / SRS30216) TaxID=266940 RepID=A6W8V3_KINRD|nr:hypothetical protein [Kineococcus radiotolerans]ABS03242.1 hypothetical protein Krad_1756 [Kineococcus radiotolerans SRS30216 = ATCC BAA-149]
MTPGEHYHEAEELLIAATKQHDTNVDRVWDICRGDQAAYVDLVAKVSANTAISVGIAHVHALLAAIPRETTP